MSTLRDINATEHLVTARKRHHCGEGNGCVITPGQDYLRLVAFPGHDANGGTRPWVMPVCIEHWRRYDPERPLPPRKGTPTEETDHGQ